MRWSAAQTLAYIITGVPHEWKDWTSKMGPEIEPAAIKLGRAVGADRVSAWGRRTPQGPIEQIPGDQFRIPGFEWVVRPDGNLATSPPHRLSAYDRLSAYEGRRWYGIEFDSDEIKQAFPKPPTARAKHWMLDEARRLHAKGKIGKRDDLLSRCRKEIGCTKRDAEAAYKSLPDKFKRLRGRPPRNPGRLRPSAKLHRPTKGLPDKHKRRRKSPKNAG
jgi:hypothetical protein